MKRKKNMPRILICGSKLQSIELSRWLSEVGIKVYVGKTTDLILSVNKYDVAHFIYSPTHRWRTLFLIPYLKLLRKKIIVHWVGSDVLSVLSRRKVRFITKIVKSLVDKNLAQSPWLKKELATININAEHVSIVPYIKGFHPLELPPKLTVLAYIPVQNPDFYGVSIILRLAKNFPNVRFFIVANIKGRSALKNVKFLGYIPYHLMPEIYKDTTVLIRMPEHDGLSFMVIEALAYGRYVIYNKPFPKCISAENYDVANQALTSLLYVKKSNCDGAKFASTFIETSVNNILKLYKGLS